MMNVCASPFIMPPPTPFPPPPIPILSPLPSPELAAIMARMKYAREQQQARAARFGPPPPLPLGAVANPKSAPLPPAEKPNSG